MRGLGVKFIFEKHENNYIIHTTPSLYIVNPDGSTESLPDPYRFIRDTEELTLQRIPNNQLAGFQASIDRLFGTHISLEYHLFNPFIPIGERLFNGPFIPEGGLAETKTEGFKKCKI